MSLFKRPSVSSFSANDYYDAEPLQTPSAVSLPEQAPEKEPGSTLNLGGGSMELKVIYPKSFSEVAPIADHLLAGRTVFLNLEATEPALCRRLLDFVSGVAYCIKGNIKRVSGTTYIVSPSSVDVSETRRGVGGADPEF
ncbi:MAG: cell division protein SepF [Clostridia bacterium]|nr:cell division protein SepF [Clostridia bacterium]